MAFGEGTINDFGGGAGDIFKGISTAESLGLKAAGDRVEAGDYRAAAKLAGENEQFTESSTSVKAMMSERKTYLGIGAEEAGIAGSGFQTGTGSSLDLLRSSASQGALESALIKEQGGITEEGYKVQQQTDTNLANYADYSADKEDSMGKMAEIAGFVSGGFKLAAGFATL